MIVEQFLREAGVARGDLVRVVRALLEYGASEAWQVAGRANVPFAELVDILQHLHAHQLLEFQDAQVRLTRAGEALARDLNLAPVHDPTCAVCGGSGVALDQFAEARREFAPLLAERPPAISRYDQGALTADSVFQRLALMCVNTSA